MTALHQLALSGLALLLAAPLTFAAPQRGKQDIPPNHPSTCEVFPDFQSLANSPFHSLGGFEFGRTTTSEIDAQLPEATIYWVETEHFEIGYALGPYKVPSREAKTFAREWAVFRQDLGEPETLSVKPKKLDPWERALLFGWRFERVYDKVQGYLGVEDADFPEVLEQYQLGTKFMGLGPHLGQRGKYEIIMLPSAELSKRYLSETFGLLVEHTQRWNVLERDSLLIVMNDSDSQMRYDGSLYGHIAYNLTIQLLDGYKHYNYEIPCYMRSGLAHVIEREITLNHSTFDLSEGGEQIEFAKSDWLTPLKKIVRSGDVPRLAELVNISSYSDMDLDDHLAAFGLTQFLLDTNPDGYAAILDDLAGLLNENGETDGSDMNRHHREAFSQFLKMSYLQLDAAFAEWVMGERADELNNSKAPRWR